MAEINDKSKKPNGVIMQNRKTLTVSGVNDVDNFDNESITAYTDYGVLTIKGKGLHMSSLSTDIGELNIEGEISSLNYSEADLKRGGFFSGLFK
ncbi:MAG: sporulation protein YabP [Clostridia bacterium]|nr:sporulation protein YabP [Clostridia bacterium]